MPRRAGSTSSCRPEALTQHWPKAFDIVADVLRNPTFPEEELERVRKERLADLKRISDEPVAISHRAIRSLVYGPDSGYGHPSNGTPASVEAMSQGRPARLLLQALRGRRIRRWWRSATWTGPSCWQGPRSSWATGRQAPGSRRVPMRRQSEPSRRRSTLVDRPGAPQSVIRAGHATVPRHGRRLLSPYARQLHLRRAPVRQAIHEPATGQGLTATATTPTSTGSRGRRRSLLAGRCRRAVTKEALVETLKEFGDIRGDRPVTPEEVSESKQGIFRSFPSQFETQGQVLQSLGRIVSFRLPDD